MPTYATTKAMQRLFTTFPNGWPAASLLLLRFALAFPLILDDHWTLSEPIAASVKLGGLLFSGLLLVGVWTPLAALLQVVTELSLAISMPGLANLHLTRAAIGLALAGLGPGAWSLDSHLYGRKRIDI